MEPHAGAEIFGQGHDLELAYQAVTPSPTIRRETARGGAATDAKGRAHSPSALAFRHNTSWQLGGFRTK
jgi:hypothetical protein